MKYKIWTVSEFMMLSLFCFSWLEASSSLSGLSRLLLAFASTTPEFVMLESGAFVPPESAVGRVSSVEYNELALNRLIYIVNKICNFMAVPMVCFLSLTYRYAICVPWIGLGLLIF